jgi:undecaprenyl-diphosphatase
VTRSGLLVFGVAVPLVGFAVLTVLGAGDPTALDRRLLDLSEGFYGIELAWDAATLALEASIVIAAAASVAALVVLLRRRLLASAAFWSLSVGGALVLDPLLKAAVRRPGIGASSDEWTFPSGSAIATLAIVLAAVILLSSSSRRRAVAVLGAIVVALEGCGMVLLGWHYTSDVVAGWLAAAAWVSTLAIAFGLHGRKPPSRRRPGPRIPQKRDRRIRPGGVQSKLS